MAVMDNSCHEGVAMEYFTLNNGVRMPKAGFGTWDVRGEKGRRCILDALDLGYRLIDTAQMYDNEDIVGRAVRESGLAGRIFFSPRSCTGPVPVTRRRSRALRNP